MKYKIYAVLILGFLMMNFSFAAEKSLHEKFNINKPALSKSVQNSLQSEQNNKISKVKNMASKNAVIVQPGNIKKTNTNLLKTINEPISVGETFKGIEFSGEHNINQLTRSESKSYLNRELFGSIDKSATYYHAHYFNSAPFVKSTFVQFVTDPAWNRVLYGNLNHWIKSIENIPGPSAIEVDASGRVFIGSTTENKIFVYQIVGEAENISLNKIFSINDIHPTDFSLNDNGTPLEIDDDFMFISDAVSNQIYKYKLFNNSAEKLQSFKEFDSPTNVLCGRVNGINSNLVYVIDKLAKRIQLFENTDKELVLLKTLQGQYDNYFTSIQSDHFGNVYIIDVTNNTISKYTFDLEFLDEIKNEETKNSAYFVKIPFGTIEIEDEGTYWAGFDQMFSAQKWTDDSGISRHQLGVSLKDIVHYSDDNNSAISTSFTLTDAAKIDYRIYDSNNQLIRIVENEWNAAGEKTLQWNRRNDNNEFAPPGNYIFEIDATSPYTEENISAKFEIYTPLYYWQDCGSVLPQDDKFVIQGEKLTWGDNAAQTVNTHESSVMYKFENLNPEGTYQIQAEFFSGDGVSRIQSITANNYTLLEDVKVSDEIVNTGFIEIPKESYENGYLILAINRMGEGSAVVSQLWINETGSSFTVNYLGNNVPETFALAQNYPNPFNPTTTIEFHLPASQNVSLKIFNILGQEIETLVQEYKKAGVHKVNFNGNNYASGLYFYQLKAGKFIQNKKMILIK